MRVLIVNCVSDRSEIALYKGLVELGVGLDLVCDPRETKQDDLASCGIKCTEIEFRSRFDFKAIAALKKILKVGGYDLVYAATSRGLCSTILSRVPIKIVTYRGTMGHLSWFMPQDRLAHLSSKVSSIACNCRAVRDFLFKFGLPKERLAVVYKGHEVDWYQSKQSVDLAEFCIPNKAFTVACAANVRPVKGLDYLIAAAAQLKDLPIHFLIIGGGKISALRNKVEKLGVEKRVHFAGFRSDATALVGASSISAMPSVDREGVPRAVIESLSQQIPSVVTSVGGMPEIVEHEKSGLVVPLKDSEALAAAIRRLCQNPTEVEAMGRQGQDFVREHLSTKVYALAMHSLFLSVLS